MKPPHHYRTPQDFQKAWARHERIKNLNGGYVLTKAQLAEIAGVLLVGLVILVGMALM